MVERSPYTRLVGGSSPSGRTKIKETHALHEAIIIFPPEGTRTAEAVYKTTSVRGVLVTTRVLHILYSPQSLKCWSRRAGVGTTQIYLELANKYIDVCATDTCLCHRTRPSGRTIYSLLPMQFGIFFKDFRSEGRVVCERGVSGNKFLSFVSCRLNHFDIFYRFHTNV